jgi:MFS family permease/quinol monooxygenase YgiN
MMQADTHSLPVIPEKAANVGDAFSNPLFRSLWIASVASNIGSTMHDVGAAWLMTELAPTPLLVSLIQTSGTLPIFMFSLFSGVLADIIPRRTLLLVTQAWMSLCAMAFAFLTLSHLMHPWSLLALNFAMAIGAAFNIPPWQSLTSDIVDRDHLKQAVVLQSAGSNIARSIGPAIGGIAVSFLGPGWVFALNGASFIGIIAVLLAWKPVVKKSRLPAERFFTALRVGVQYVRNSQELQNILIRTALFVLGAIAAISLLPLLVKERLHEGPKVLGLLLGLNGVGAVGMAIWLKHLKIKPDDELTFGTIAYGTAIMLLAWTHDLIPYCVAMLLAGAGWMMANSTLNTATQLSSPAWVKARAVSMQQLTFYGSIAIGSLWWGFAATRIHTHNALSFAAIFLFVGLVAAKVTKLSHAFEINVDKAVFMQEPEVDHHHAIPLDHGPVMVTVEYRINEGCHADFEADMQQIKNVRARTGALRWELFCDAADRNRYIEIFFSETWADHLREHERTTLGDKKLQERVNSYHTLNERPKVSHYIYDTRKYLSNGEQHDCDEHKKE